MDPSRIPLHLAAGPTLEVSTTNDNTQAWLESVLLGEQSESSDESLGQEWWSVPYAQSPVGILLKAEDGAGDGTQRLGDGPRVTELLLYASIVTPSDLQLETLPTPPISSPAPGGDAMDNTHGSGEQPGMDVRVYALPLSSELLYNAAIYPMSQSQASPAVGLSQDLSEKDELQYGQFLPTLVRETSPSHTTPRKRQRMTKLFEEADMMRRKVKGRGGEGVSRMIAERKGSLQPIKTTGKGANAGNTKLMGERDEGAASQARSQQPPGHNHLRSASRTSVAGFEAGKRPQSRRESVSQLRQTGRSRVASISAQPDRFQSPAPADEGTSSIEKRNKAALSRVVMAGMRLHGLTRHQNESQPSRPSTSNGRPESEELYGSNEYKLVYHQTLKGATFAFRRSIQEATLGQEVMRDVVDRLLALYCCDPTVTTASFGTEPDGLGIEPNAIFDPPSGRSREARNCSPEMIKKKRHKDAEREIERHWRSVSPSAHLGSTQADQDPDNTTLVNGTKAPKDITCKA